MQTFNGGNSINYLLMLPSLNPRILKRLINACISIIMYGTLESVGQTAVIICPHTYNKFEVCCSYETRPQTSLFLSKMQAVHTGDKPFKCEECDKTFRTQIELQSHMGRHTGVKPFKCDTCDKEFISAITFKRHAIVHSGQYENEWSVYFELFAFSCPHYPLGLYKSYAQFRRYAELNSGVKFDCSTAVAQRLNQPFDPLSQSESFDTKPFIYMKGFSVWLALKQLGNCLLRRTESVIYENISADQILSSVRR